MKGSPLAIVISAAVVIIGGSIVTYLLIENAPQESGFNANQPQNVQRGEPRVPRPKIFEDKELPALPSLPESDRNALPRSNTTSSPSSKPPRSSTQSTGGNTGGGVLRPIPSIPESD